MMRGVGRAWEGRRSGMSSEIWSLIMKGARFVL